MDNWFLLLDEGSNTWASREVTSVEADSPAVAYTVYDFQAVYTSSAQITYDVQSLSGTISGGASFPFASTTSDLTEYFTVLNAVAEKDLVTTYSARQAIDTQVYATWRVLTGVEANSPAITYNHAGVVYSDYLIPEYRVLTGVEKDSASVSYTVVAQVLKDSTATYAVVTNPLTATNVQPITYRVIASAQTDLVSAANVLTYAQKDLVPTSRLLTEALKDRVTSYNVSGSVTADKVFQYVLLTPVGVSSDGTYVYQIISDSAVVPNVVGLTLEDATSVLIAAGFTVGNITEVTLQ